MLPETGASTSVTACASASCVSWSASAAPTLLICNQIVPSGHVLEQGFNDFEDDGGGREHGDHNPGTADHLARPFGRLPATTFKGTNWLGVAVPRDDRDALIEKPMGHGRAHQADAKQPGSDLLLISLGLHFLCLRHLIGVNLGAHVLVQSFVGLEYGSNAGALA